jgi:general stress protein YciG
MIMRTIDGGADRIPGEDNTNAEPRSETQGNDGQHFESRREQPPREDGHDTMPAPPSDASGADRQVRRPRGFAAMDRKLVSEIARKGGKAAHAAGTAHEFTSEEARLAGGKGGRATHENRRRLAQQRSSEHARGSGVL